MAGKANNNTSVIVACLAALIQISSLAATTWTVGDTTGWVTSGSDYSSWASGKNFSVGDTLVFNFMSGAHTVTEVSKSDYEGCTTINVISSTNSGPANIALSTSGTHYYICTYHCSTSNQKLSITVGSSSTPPPLPLGFMCLI